MIARLIIALATVAGGVLVAAPAAQAAEVFDAPVVVARDHGGHHINARHDYPRWVDCRKKRFIAHSNTYFLGDGPDRDAARQTWHAHVDLCHNNRSKLDWADPIDVQSQIRMIDPEVKMKCAGRHQQPNRIQGVTNIFTWRNEDGIPYDLQDPQFSYTCYQARYEISQFNYFWLPQRYFYDGRKQVWLSTRIEAHISGQRENWTNKWSTRIHR